MAEHLNVVVPGGNVSGETVQVVKATAEETPIIIVVRSPARASWG